MDVFHQRREHLDVDRLVVRVPLDDHVRLSRVAIEPQQVQATPQLCHVNRARGVEIELIERVRQMEHSRRRLSQVHLGLMLARKLLHILELFPEVDNVLPDVLVQVALGLKRVFYRVEPFILLLRVLGHRLEILSGAPIGTAQPHRCPRLFGGRLSHRWVLGLGWNAVVAVSHAAAPVPLIGDTGDHKSPFVRRQSGWCALGCTHSVQGASLEPTVLQKLKKRSKKICSPCW